ncbi:MAG: hypothetical protein U9Q63_03690 [Patescibacteria group bacterium]|nr:hypothetical protein [Patescibacteria group bacterium]
MKKEALIAIIVGLIFGLIITIGIYTANRSINQLKAKKTTQKNTITPSPPTQLEEKSLEITSHESFDLINQSEITLSGIAWSNAIIALLTENQEFMAVADSDGIFSFNFDLIKGYNEIQIIATDDTGEISSKDLIITYSTTKIELE